MPDVVASLDRAPEHWPRIDALLRTLATRLTHVAEGRTAALDHLLARLRERLREPLDEEPLQQLAHELTDAVRTLDEPIRAIADTAAEPGARTALLTLISALQLGAADDAALDDLRGAVAEARDDAQMEKQAKTLAAVLNRAYRLHASQREALQRLLSLVTGQLGELAQYLDRDAVDHEDGADARRTLDRNLSEEIDALGVQLESAADLSSLRSELKSGMAAITKHLQTFHDQEDARARAWQARSAELDRRVHELERSTQDMEASLRKEHQLATTDALTGIPNRMVFEEHMREVLGRARAGAATGCLLVLDIDWFKTINDRYGHAAGDRALCIVARQLQAALRPGDLIARYGGEEFVVVLPDSGIQIGQEVAERLRRQIELTPFHGKQRPVQITISCGVTALRNGDTRATAFARADRAVYLAKNNGRNRCETQ